MGSSKPVTSGYNYFGTFAQALGVGPATRLTRITNGDSEIWSGDLNQSSRNAEGMTYINTTLGGIRFYWGREDQSPDVLLRDSTIDFGSGPVSLLIPAWPRVIYFVADGLAFGSQPVPPTLKFEFERQLSVLDISAHDISKDAVIPEVLYELLTDTLFGVGIDPAAIDLASFVSAAETVIAEGVGASPWIDANTTVREFVGLLLSYIDGYLRYEAGRIKLGLVRNESTAGLTLIDESLLADEPQPSNEGWNNTWNYTRVVFTDRAHKWRDDAVEAFEDVANAVTTGERKDEEIRLPFVTRRAVAKILAKRKGLKGGVPAMTWNLEVMPSLRALRPGDLVKLSFAKRGIVERVVRVQEVNRSARDNRLVKLTVTEEVTRDESHDYVIPDDDFTSEPDEFVLVPTVPRLSTLTSDLKAGKLDGYLVACERPHPLIEGVKVYFTWDPLQKAYGKVAARTSFPAKGVLSWWTRARNNTTWILRIDFQTSSDAQRVLALLDDSGEFYAVVGRRLYKSVGSALDQHQVDALWFQAVADGYRMAISDTELELEFTSGAWGSLEPSLETEADEAIYPTEHIYVGRILTDENDDFAIVRGNAVNFDRSGGNAGTLWRPDGTTVVDSDKKRYVTAPVYNAIESQELADAGVNFYDRNDATMCPEGTYDTDWGSRVPTLAERYDDAGGATAMGGVHPDQVLVDSADQALYRITFDLDSEDDFLLAEETDNILGFMTATGADWYNKT